LISPLLANVYLHHALDLWAERWRRHEATGDMIIVRYADDFIVGFQHEGDARRFLDELRNRLEEYALSLHPEKTRLIEFGRFAAQNRKSDAGSASRRPSLPGLHFICGKCAGSSDPKEDSTRSTAEQAQGDRRHCGSACIRASRAGEMLMQVVKGLLQLPCGADQ